MERCGLQVYADKLLRNGFDEMDTLLSIEDADMEELGFQPHHARHLRSCLHGLSREGAAGAGGGQQQSQLVAFLTNHGLGQYSTTLIRSGFDSMEALRQIDDSDLADLGLPRGHSLKLRKVLREHFADTAAAGHAKRHSVEQRSPCQPQKVAVAEDAGAAADAALPDSGHGTSTAAPTDKMKGDVQKSWERVQEVGTLAVGELLYKNTFKLAPEAVAFFPPEVLARYRECTFDENEDKEGFVENATLRKLFSRVLNAVGCAVTGLFDLGKLVPMLTALGARHVAYGIPEPCWEVLGEALNMTLREVLREGFTHEVETAWTIVYKFISSIMIQGMRDAKAKADAAAAVAANLSSKVEVVASESRLATVAGAAGA